MRVTPERTGFLHVCRNGVDLHAYMSRDHAEATHLVLLFMQCKIGKVIGNLHALLQLMPETVDSVAVVQYMPMLLLSNMKKVRPGTFV